MVPYVNANSMHCGPNKYPLKLYQCESWSGTLDFAFGLWHQFAWWSSKYMYWCKYRCTHNKYNRETCLYCILLYPLPYSLCTNGFVLLVWYNKLGLVHCIYRRDTSYNFQIKLYFILWRSLFVTANSENPDEMQHYADFIWFFTIC